MKRYWAWLLVLALVLAAIGLFFTPVLAWVGGTDLEVVFVVVDDESGEPIRGATVAVNSGGGFYLEEDQQRDREPFALQADDKGEARRVCRQTRCVGRYGYWGLVDTFAVYVPEWQIEASAPGYAKRPIASMHQSFRDA